MSVAALDLNAIRLALKTWADTCGGIPFIWANQNGPTPDMPFGTLQLMSTEGFGDFSTQYVDNPAPVPGAELLKKSEQQGRMTISVNTYDVPEGMNAWIVAEKLRSSLSIPAEITALTGAGLAPARMPTIMDASDVAGAHFRGRAMLTIDFNVALCVETTETIIESVELEATINDEAGAPILDGATFTVP